MKKKFDIPQFFKNAKKKISAAACKLTGSGRDTKAAWKKLRPISIYVISAVVVLVIMINAISLTLGILFGAADKHDDSPVLIDINSGASLSYVASKLKDSGLIKTSLGIKLLADFTSVSSKIQSGQYVLDKTMTVQEILDVITKPTASARVSSVTFVEGTTVEDFAELLVNAGIITNKDSFLNECKNGKNYSDYYFTQPLYNAGNLRYLLEGYLFPDTYEFYVGSSNEVIINRLLTRTNELYTAQMTEKAESMGLTMHQVITLASIVEKEGRGADFAKIAAVFHNRIAKGMRLESDVTVQYAIGVKRLVLTSDELKTDSPYNTYLVSGIPAGPICNPGLAAIKAVLYPDQDILNGGYLYFTLTDPYTGEVAYSRTYDEHVAIKNKYKSVWAAYDKAQGNK